jgi:hypothetical protein
MPKTMTRRVRYPIVPLTRNGPYGRPFDSKKHRGSGELPSSGKLFMDQPESIERLRWYAHPNWKSVIPNGDVMIIDQGTAWTDPWVIYATRVGSSVLIGLARPFGAGTPCRGLLISANGMKRLATMIKKA